MIEVVNMNLHETECRLCGAVTEHRWGVPVVNGDPVSNEFPDEILSRHGGGISVCEACFNKHARDEVPTFDRFYLHLREGFSEGLGI